MDPSSRIFPLALSFAALTSITHAGIIVTRGHIIGGSATGTLVAMDSPFISNASGTTGSFGGPSWTTGGTIFANQADQGFAAASSPSGDGIREFDIAGTPWEPNGTPFSQARGYYIYPDGPSPGTTWTFNLAASGIDLPDGTIIHGVYARFGGRNNDRARYEYTEGASSANLVVDQFSAGSSGDLALRWFDSDGNPRDSNFQRIFSNPITVTGGDGFQLRITDTTLGSAGHIDAIVLDTSLPKVNDVPVISTLLPVDNKTSVVPWTSLEVAFDEPVAFTGIGTVTITDLTDGSSTRVINLPNPQVTSPNGDDLLIKPSTKLELGTNYSVRISADALVDLATEPNAFSGILNDTTWNFSTRAVPNQLHNVLIVTCALADAQPSATTTRATNLLFHDPLNVDEAMRASSYGQIGLNLGDSSGLPATVQLSYPETVAQQKASIGSTGLKNRMATSLSALGYNLSQSNFRFILYIQPEAMSSGAAGWANLGSNTSTYLSPIYMRLAMHEMGHCLGGNHSNGSDLGCSLGGADVDYNASKKILYGWLSAFPGTVVNLPANTGTSLSLVPLSRNPAVMAGVRAVRVPNPNGGTATYLVSYKIDDGPYNTLQNSSYARKVHVTEDAGGSSTTHRATLGAGQEYVVGKLKVKCDSVAADGLSAAATITINTAPVAVAQSVSVNEDTATPVVLAGTDADFNPLTYTVLSQPTRGTLSGIAPNLTYTPSANLNGADSFTFKVNDGIVDSAIATVSINVNPVNDVPVALAQSATTAEDAALPITLAGSDVEDSALTYHIVTPPANGTLSGTAPNLTFTPTADFNGADEFTFTVNDGTADSAITTVAINVTPLNDTPVAFAQSLNVNEDDALSLTLNGADADLDSLTYNVVSLPANGALGGTAPNLTFTPTANFNGTDGFTFSVNDGTVDSAIVTVSILVAAINDAPSAAAQNLTTEEDTALAILLAGTDVDPDTLTYSIVTQPANGTLSGMAPNLTYTPDADTNGADGFTYVVNDGTVDSATATVAINVTSVNDSPVAVAQSLNTDEDTALAITLTGTDADPDTLTYNVVTQPANGTLTGTPPNLTYTPTANSNGADGFTFTVNDGTVNSTTALVSINVTSVNDAPVALVQSVITDENSSLPITLGGTDIETSTLTYNIATPPTSGSLSGIAPDVIYTPSLHFSGADSFTFVVNDGTADSVPATISITVRPVASLSWDANGAAANHTDGTGAWLNASQWRDNGINVGWTSGLGAVFGNGGAGGAVSLASPTTAASLTFNSFTGTYTLGTAGTALTLNKGITKNSGSGTASVISPVILGGSQTWTNHSTSSLNVTGGINTSGHTLSVAGSGITSFAVTSNLITGNGGITKTGSGRLVLGAASPVPSHSYSGTTTIDGGSILVSNFNLGGGNLTLNDGYLDFYFGGTFTRSLGGGSGQARITGGTSGFSNNGSTGATVRLGNSSSVEIVWGSASFNPSTLVLQAADAQNNSSLTLDNRIDLNGENRTIFTSTTTGSGAGSATLSQIVRNSTGTAGLIKTGSGRLNLNAANTYNGGTTLQSGTLQLGNASALGSASGTLTVNGGLLNLNSQSVSIGNLAGTSGTIANNGGTARTLTIGSGNGSGGIYQGVIANRTLTGTGTVALTKTGSGTITLANSNTYSGATIINGGTLILAGATQATTAITLASGGSLGLTVGTPVTAASAAVSLANGTVSVTGTPTASSHVLLTAASITGSPVLANPIPDYELVVSGNQLLLNSTAPQEMMQLMSAGNTTGSEGSTTETTVATPSNNEATTSITDSITTTGLPLPWTSGDIGIGMLTGSATFNAGTFTQAGSGIIGSTADKLRFTYQNITGDGEIIARISGLENTGNSSRVGVMIRDSLAPNSKEIFMGLTGSNAYRWDNRTTTGGSTSSNYRSKGTIPNTWVRLVRSGTTITAFTSPDGTSWTSVGSTTNTTFATTCYIGLAVGSGSDTNLNTSQFGNVSVTP